MVVVVVRIERNADVGQPGKEREDNGKIGIRAIGNAVSTHAGITTSIIYNGSITFYDQAVCTN